MRDAVQRVIELGPLPDDDDLDADAVGEFEEAVDAIPEPVTDEEARALVKALGPGDAYGVNFSLVHKIETAPGWPLEDALPDGGNQWVKLLRERAERG
jgi:hypothetical protein